MVILHALERAAAELTSICALAAALELLVRDDGAELGFRSICALAVALGALRAVMRAIG